MFTTSLCHLTAMKPAVLLFFVLFGVESYFRRFGSSRQDNLTHVSLVWKVLLCLVWSPSWGASGDTQRGHLTWQHPAFNLSQRTPVLHYWAELQQLVQCASEILQCSGAGTASKPQWNNDEFKQQQNIMSRLDIYNTIEGNHLQHTIL